MPFCWMHDGTHDLRPAFRCCRVSRKVSELCETHIVGIVPVSREEFEKARAVLPPDTQGMPGGKVDR